MRLLAPIAIAVAVAAAPAGALAADIMTLPMGTGSVPVADGTFDWSGFYAGVYGATRSSPLYGLEYGLGLDVGTTAHLQMVLVGGEVAVEGFSGGTAYVQGLGKLGLVLGDNVAAYALTGVGSDLGLQADALVGGGIELAIDTNVSIDARYLHGFAVQGANPKDQVTVGANFHF
jgi:outer membrane immunogenic protein